MTLSNFTSDEHSCDLQIRKISHLKLLLKLLRAFACVCVRLRACVWVHLYVSTPKPDHHWGPWGHGPGPRALRGLAPWNICPFKKVVE